MTKESEDKTFEKFVAISQIAGFLFLLMAGYVWAFGLPNFQNLDEKAKFCYEEGGRFIDPSRESYNEALCLFEYPEDSWVWGQYAMDKITNEQWAEMSGHKVGEYCLVCWDSSSCSRDVLTKIDNGTRRHTRC